MPYSAKNLNNHRVIFFEFFQSRDFVRSKRVQERWIWVVDCLYPLSLNNVGWCYFRRFSRNMIEYASRISPSNHTMSFFRFIVALFDRGFDSAMGFLSGLITKA